MLSIGKAQQGGDSRWVSSITIHNELLRRGRRVTLARSLCAMKLVVAEAWPMLTVKASGYIHDILGAFALDSIKSKDRLSTSCGATKGRSHLQAKFAGESLA